MPSSGDFYTNPSLSHSIPRSTNTANRLHTGLMGYLLGALTMLAVVGGSQFLLRRPDPPPIAFHAPPAASPTVAPVASPSPLPTFTPAPIIIFVSGAVIKPGLYQLSAEARVGDALQMAGGLLPDANVAIVNQAEKLWDGVQVHVPSLNEMQTVTQPPVGVSGVRSAAMTAPAPQAGNASISHVINLNTATLEQLDTLPGIGPAKGQAIIDNRPYATVDDLERVSGIGASTINQLRDFVTTE